MSRDVSLSVLAPTHCFNHVAEAFREKWKIASSKSVVNFGICFGATQSNASELSRLDRRKVAAVKLFMGSSTGNMLVDDEADLLTVFEQSRLPIIAHCEDSTIIAENLKAAKKVYGPDPALYCLPLYSTSAYI